MRENKLVHWEIKERIQHLADYADDFFVEDNYGQYAWIREDIPETMREFIFEVLAVCSDMLEEIEQDEREMKRKIVKQSFDKCVEKNGGALEKLANTPDHDAKMEQIMKNVVERNYEGLKRLSEDDNI